ncbi:extracellular solute-binding protein [Clostridioides sp. ES-S-0108-01]|uniref:ABC transporter substrate-binding protein n=1 Tax=Clostridioides sp. ES-S-0108-01 TaxID=2770773 RepID=UPI001D0C3804|nr:extracellular solute-binding protein [Clostridioides sp. ES-S-0108-01]UDN49904.1 extracellular solute-binding protein [Clostridioides sp. ES-S-0107-01]
MKLNTIVKSVIILSLLIMCVGCQNNKATNIVIDNNDDDIIDLRIFGFKNEAINVVAIEEILQDYMAKHPNVKINYESVKGVEYYNVLEKRLNSNNHDDIFMMDEEHLQKLKDKGYFEDLSKLSTINNFSKKSLEQMKEDNGKIYYVPSTISAFGLYCNMDILNKHHQKVPQNEKEFMEVCQYFVDKGITPIIANNDISLKTIAIGKSLYPLYQADNSHELIKHINKNPEVLSDYMKTGYEFVEKIIKNKFIDATKTSKTEKTKDDLIQFEKGENPFMLTGAWASVRVQNDAPNLNFEVHPYPILKEGSMLVTNIDTRLCVNAKGKHVEEAKKFIEYITQDNIMWKFVNSQSSFSPLKELRIADDKTIKPLSLYINDKDAILGTDSRIQYPIWSLTREGVQKLMKGEDIESALKIIKDSK